MFEVVCAYERRFGSLSNWTAASVGFGGGEVRAWFLYSEIISFVVLNIRYVNVSTVVTICTIVTVGITGTVLSMESTREQL